MISAVKLITSIIGALFQSSAATYILKAQSPETSKKNLLKFNLIVFISDVLCSLYVPNTARFVYNVMVLIFILYFFLKIRNRKSIIYSFLIMIILPLSEIIVTLGMVIVGIKSNIIIENYYYNLLANILISLLAILIMTIPFIKKQVLKVGNYLINNKKSIYYIIIIAMVLYFIVLKNGFELLHQYSYYINIFVVLGMLLLFMLIMLSDLKSDQLKEINKQSMNYINKYEKIITEQGKANHEFRNQLMVIRGYAKDKSPKLIEYIDSIIDDTKKTKNTYLISQLNKFPDGGIKGLIYYKLSIMEEENIKYNIYCDDAIKRKAKNLSLDEMKNITKVLGVLIDNAIDECKKIDNKVIDIALTADRGKMTFSISNPIKSRKNINKFGTGFTTKGKNHGYGLQLVKDIINDNRYIEYSYGVTEDSYIVNLTILTGNKKTYKKNL